MVCLYKVSRKSQQAFLGPSILVVQVLVPQGDKVAESTIIDGIAGSEAIDSSGEILDVAGADISDLVEGRATLSWEHKDEKDPAHTAMDHVGKIVYAKKIFKESDCEDDRQRMYWKKVELPYIYFKTRLYDGAGHPAAIALAAIFRDAEQHNEPVLARYSVEGATLKKEGNRLLKTVVRRVTATVKPCNRSAVSGIVSDAGPVFLDESSKKKQKEQSAEESSSTFDKLVERVGKAESVHGRLGGAVEVEYSPLDKATEAGVTSAAPSALSGGAALQREDRGLILKNLAHRATQVLQRWDRKGDPKKYLKSEMPDVDPDFLDRFAEMAENFKLKASSLKKAQQNAPEEDVLSDGSDTVGKEVIVPPHLKDRFKKVAGSRPSPTKLGESYFDTATGTLHTDLGSFKVHIPQDKYYSRILKSSEVAPHHDEAMRHWKNLNALLRAGKLPPEIIMHAAIFSGMSPSTAVPMQELAFSHIKDLMARGLDPTKSGSASPEFKRDFMERVGKDTAYLPDYYNSYWASEAGRSTRVKEEKQLSLLTPNAPPRQKGMVYPTQKWNSVAWYHKLHPTLVSLVQKYGADGRAMTRELLAMKTAGKSSPGLSKVEGFAPKTIRYLLGMLGAGNAHVPDTHYIRHTFGLPSDKQVKKETVDWLGRPLAENESALAPNAHLKRVLWNPRTPEVGEALDSYYYHNHPAVRHVIQRHFGGQEDEQATFPAFWAHWLSIGPHEKKFGQNNFNYNDGTDHRVYWNAVNEVLREYGLPTTRVKKNEDASPEEVLNMPIAERTARAHAKIADAFGETPGLLFYYQHCVPALLEEHDQRMSQPIIDPVVMKMEAALIELRKNSSVDRLYNSLKAAGVQPAKASESDSAAVDNPFKKPVVWRGQYITPGVSENNVGKRFFHIAEKDGRVYGFKEDRSRYSHLDYPLTSLPKAYFDSDHTVLQPSQIAGAENAGKVSLVEHTDPHWNTTEEQRKLLQDLDFSDSSKVDRDGEAGINQRLSHWRNTPAGLAYVKLSEDHQDQQGKHEIAYHNIARDLFGMGEYLADTAAFRHPQTGHIGVVVRGIDNAISGDSADYNSYRYGAPAPSIKSMQEDMLFFGEMDKLAAMNYVLGNNDRHPLNYLIRRENGEHKLKLIDHGFSFSEGATAGRPDYYVMNTDRNYRIATEDLPRGHQDHRMHPAAQKMLEQIDPVVFEQEMRKYGIQEDRIRSALRRLKIAQEAAKGQYGNEKPWFRSLRDLAQLF